MSHTAGDSEDVVQAALAHGAMRVLLEALGSLLSWELSGVASGERLRTSLVKEGQAVRSCLVVIQGVAGKTEGGNSPDAPIAFSEPDSEERADVLKQALCFSAISSTAVLRPRQTSCATKDFVWCFHYALRILTLHWPESGPCCACAMPEGNHENQNYVQSLQPQGDAIIQDEAMRKAGFSVVLDPASSKFKLRRDGL